MRLPSPIPFWVPCDAPSRDSVRLVEHHRFGKDLLALVFHFAVKQTLAWLGQVDLGRGSLAFRPARRTKGFERRPT